MKLSDLGLKRYGNYKDYMASAKRDLAEQHTKIINKDMKAAELDGRGKLTSQSHSRAVQKDLEKVTKVKPTIYKKPQSTYP